MPVIEESNPEGAIGTRSAPPEIVAVGLFALVVGISTRFLTKSSLWLDEALTISISSVPLGDLTSTLKHDGHPPLFYVLMHFWSSWFGTGDFASRSLAGVFGLLCLPLAWILGRRKGGPALGWIAVSVVALSPYAVRYSSEARMYSLVMLLVFAGWVLLDDIIVRHKATALRFVGLGVVAIALPYTHYWSLWLLAAVGLVALFQIWRSRNDPGIDQRSWIIMIAILVVAAVSFAPWLPTMLYQGAHTGTPWATPSRPTTALSVTLVEFGAGGYGERELVGALFLVALLLGLFGRAVNRTSTVLEFRAQRDFRIPALIAAISFAIGCAVSFVAGSAFASRYAAVIFPMAIMLVAAGLTRFSDRWIRFGVVAVMCGFLTLGAVWNIRSTRTQLGVIGTVVSQQAQPDDIVVFCPDQLGPATLRALRNDVVSISYPDGGDGQFVDWVDYGIRNGESDPVAFADSVIKTAGQGRSIYVVANGAYKTFEGKCELLLAQLGAVRPGVTLVADDGAAYAEHASLTVFPAPK